MHSRLLGACLALTAVQAPLGPGLAHRRFQPCCHLAPVTAAAVVGRALGLAGKADCVLTPFLQVRYRLPPFAWAREPLLWAASLAAVLGAVLIFLRSDFSLVRPGAANEARGRSQANAVAARAVAVFAGAFINLQTLKIIQCPCSGAANEARSRSQAGALAARAVAVFAGALRSQLGGRLTKSISRRVVYCRAS